MKVTGQDKAALIDIDRASEFSGDDVDRYSGLVDLGANYSEVMVWVPALDASAVVSLYAQRESTIATVPFAVQSFDADATGHFLQATSSGAGSLVVVFKTGAVRYVRVHASANQAADRTFYVRGC